MHETLSKSLAITTIVGALLSPNVLQAEIFHSGTGSIDGFLCVGFECNDYFQASGRTLVLKEDSVQLIFEDDSDSPFPTNDWEITINDPTASGDEYFQIRDITNNSNPFRIAAGAATSALWVDSNSNVGLGTGLPEGPLHIRETFDSWIRLETTANGGYEWDLVGNSTNFIIRDAPNNRLPFRMFPGVENGMLVVNPTGVGINTNDGLGSVDVRAPLDVRGDALVSGDLGVGTDTPDAPLHVLRTGLGTPVDPTAPAGLLVETSGTTAPRGLLTLRNQGQVFFALEDTTITAGSDTGRQWNFQNLGGEFRITTAPGGGSDIEMRLTPQGDMTIEGNYFASSGTQLNVPDYVFSKDYDLKPLSEVQAFIDKHSHLPDVPSASQINAEGLNMTDMQMRLLKKVEELTLYTLAQEARLDEVATLRAQNAALMARLVQVEAALVSER